MQVVVDWGVGGEVENFFLQGLVGPHSTLNCVSTRCGTPKPNNAILAMLRTLVIVILEVTRDSH